MGCRSPAESTTPRVDAEASPPPRHPARQHVQAWKQRPFGRTPPAMAGLLACGCGPRDRASLTVCLPGDSAQWRATACSPPTVAGAAAESRSSCPPDRIPFSPFHTNRVVRTIEVAVCAGACPVNQAFRPPPVAGRFPASGLPDDPAAPEPRAGRGAVRQKPPRGGDASCAPAAPRLHRHRAGVRRRDAGADRGAPGAAERRLAHRGGPARPRRARSGTPARPRCWSTA